MANFRPQEAIWSPEGRIPIFNDILLPEQTEDSDCFHLSFNRYSGEYGCPTTAVVLGQSYFLVLRGDHRDELAKRANEGYFACYDYCVEHEEELHDLSEPLLPKDLLERFIESYRIWLVDKSRQPISLLSHILEKANKSKKERHATK